MWNLKNPFFPRSICEIINASIGETNSQLIAAAATVDSDFLNAAYPNMTIGGKVTFTNITDQSGDYLVFTKITSTTWASSAPLSPV